MGFEIVHQREYADGTVVPFYRPWVYIPDVFTQDPKEQQHQQQQQQAGPSA